MNYEKTPINRTASKSAVRSTINNQIAQIGTPTIIWHLVRRHRLALLASYAVVATALLLVPSLPFMLLAILFN